MKVAVCIKEIPDLSNISISKSQGKIFEKGPRILNPADESALEFALSLKEKEKAQIHVLSVGQNEKILRYAYAMGADFAYLIWDEAYRGADPFVLANILSAAIKNLGQVDLVITGGGSITGWGAQVGPRIAQELKVKVLSISSAAFKPRIPKAKEVMDAFRKKIQYLSNADLNLDEDSLTSRVEILRSYLWEG